MSVDSEPSQPLLGGDIFGVPEGATYVGQAAQKGTVIDPTGKYKLVMRKGFAAIEAGVQQGDFVKSNAGVMVSMSNNVSMVVTAEGGCGMACCRGCCAGGSIFLSIYNVKPNAQNKRGDILLAPPMPGEIVLLNLDGTQSWVLGKGAFLCADANVIIGTKFQNCSQCCCSGQGLVVMKATGEGRLLICSFGSITKYELQPGEHRKIDNGYLVAWDNKMKYTIQKAADTIGSSILSTEFFVTEFVGPGTVYVQSRSPRAMVNYLEANTY